MSSDLANSINFVKSKLLATHTIKVKQIWLTECVEYFSANGYIGDYLFEAVLEQFLNSDVKDSSNPVIPATVIQKKDSFTLNGTFVLQMMHLIDICKMHIELS